MKKLLLILSLWTSLCNAQAVLTTNNIQTVSNKVIPGTTNTFSAIPQTAITNLLTDLSGIRTKISSDSLILATSSHADSTVYQTKYRTDTARINLYSALALKAPIASPTFTTQITTPIILGGTGTTSTLTFKPTSGVGTTGADIIFGVGNNGATEAMRVLNNSAVLINTLQIGGSDIFLNRPTGGTLNINATNVRFSDNTSLIGGTTTTSSLTYKTTTGVGTTGADHVFLVGNNGATEAMRILNSGQAKFPIPAEVIEVVK